MDNIKNRIFPMFIIIAVSVLSCKEKHKVDPITIDQETKDFIVFEATSFWVYKNSKRIELDTWKVVSIKKNIIPASEMNQEFERMEMKVSTIYRDTFQIIVRNRSARFFSSKDFGIVQDAYFEDTKTQEKYVVTTKLD